MATDHLLMCVGREAVTRDMTTFTFQIMAPGGASATESFPFQPGQFLSLTVDIDGVDVQRCYTISSPPTRAGSISISVKRVAGGHVSNWLHDNMVTGMVVLASGPLGRFTYAARPAEKYLFVSGGSGITPVMSMLRAVTDADTPTDIVFVHSARSLDEIPFRAELEALADRHPNLTLAFACTRQLSVRDSDPHAPIPIRRMPPHSGRIDRAALERICPDLADRESFVCGPGPFRSAVRTALRTAGADPQRIHEESFGFALPESDGTDVDAVVVDFTRRSRRVSVTPGSTILAAAAAAGVTLPSTCGIGMCRSCKVRKVSGDVVMNHQGGIRQREIAQGKILLCCSEPLSPVVIDF